MTTKMISVSLPEEMLLELDEAARREQCSRAELIREALRRYLADDRLVPLGDAKSDEIKAIVRGRRQFEQGEFIRLEDLQNELGLPTR